MGYKWKKRCLCPCSIICCVECFNSVFNDVVYPVIMTLVLCRPTFIFYELFIIDLYKVIYINLFLCCKHMTVTMVT